MGWETLYMAHRPGELPQELSSKPCDQAIDAPCRAGSGRSCSWLDATAQEVPWAGELHPDLLSTDVLFPLYESHRSRSCYVCAIFPNLVQCIAAVRSII